MKRILVIALVLLSIASISNAQSNALPTSKLGWDQPAPTLQDASAYTYKYYADGSSGGGVILLGVTCTGPASPYSCEVAFPAFTPGDHTLQVTASNLAGESAKSNTLSFKFIVVPAAPQTLKIK